MTAQQGNQTAFTSGLKSRQALMLGKVPKNCTWSRRAVQQLRGQLEAAVEEQKGSLSLTDAMYCQSICRHEMRALLCVRWLRLSSETMTIAERLGCLKEMGAATVARDRAVAKLGLGPADETDELMRLLYGSGGGSVLDEPSGNGTVASQPSSNGTVPSAELADADIEAIAGEGA